MDILSQDCIYSSKAEFEKLITEIEKLIEIETLERYVDPSWKGRSPKQGYSGLYISRINKKIYQLYGTNYTTLFGEEHYKGNWKIFREEKIEENKWIKITSAYEIRLQEPGCFAFIRIELRLNPEPLIAVSIIWEKEHHSFIKSAVEFGIISAFEDLNMIEGKVEIIIKDLRYHHIDSSFSLLEYVSNRNMKRAFFKEEEILYPTLENGTYLKKFKGNLTIGKYIGRSILNK